MTATRKIEFDTPWAGQTFSPPVPQGLAAVEQAILDHLRDMAARYGGPLAKVLIDHFPDTPEAYRLVHPVGAVLVAFGESSFAGAPMVIDEVTSERTVSWDFNVAARDLGRSFGGQPSGTSPGAYGVLDGLRLALCGFQVPGFTKFIPVHERFTRRDTEGGVWYYEARFSHCGVVVQVEPEVSYPTWVATTWREVAGQTAEAAVTESLTVDEVGRVTLDCGNVSGVEVEGVASTEYTVDAARGVVTFAPGGAVGPGDQVGVTYRAADLFTVQNGN